MHEPCVGLQYFRLRPACLRLTNLVQFNNYPEEGLVEDAVPLLANTLQAVVVMAAAVMAVVSPPNHFAILQRGLMLIPVKTSLQRTGNYQ